MSETSKTCFFGIGGGGGLCLNHLLAANLQNVEFIAANTDAQALGLTDSPVKIQLGSELLHGLGTKGSVELGRKVRIPFFAPPGPPYPVRGSARLHAFFSQNLPRWLSVS